MLLWTKHALEDLDKILNYINNYDKDAACRVAHAIDEVCKQIELYKKIGMQGRVSGTREFFLSKYPYVIIYRIQDSHLEILRLLHTHQQWV